ncbi:hypothetical protein BDV06DRAFT_218209 [Aspergillus oleicola]
MYHQQNIQGGPQPQPYSQPYFEVKPNHHRLSSRVPSAKTKAEAKRTADSSADPGTGNKRESEVDAGSATSSSTEREPTPSSSPAPITSQHMIHYPFPRKFRLPPPGPEPISALLSKIRDDIVTLENRVKELEGVIRDRDSDLDLNSRSSSMEAKMDMERPPSCRICGHLESVGNHERCLGSLAVHLDEEMSDRIRSRNPSPSPSPIVSPLGHDGSESTNGQRQRDSCGEGARPSLWTLEDYLIHNPGRDSDFSDVPEIEPIDDLLFPSLLGGLM